MTLKGKERLILIVIAASAVLAGLLFLLFLPDGAVAVVSVNGKETNRISLSRDGTYHIEANLPVTLIVEDSSIRFEGSVCPDKLCEGFGRIGDAYEYAICMPAGVVVMIEDPQQNHTTE